MEGRQADDGERQQPKTPGRWVSPYNSIWIRFDQGIRGHKSRRRCGARYGFGGALMGLPEVCSHTQKNIRYQRKSNHAPWTC